MKNKLFILYFLGLILFGISCNKVKPTTANILIRDENKIPVSGAEVSIYPSPNESNVKLKTDSTLKNKAITGSNGKVNFDYSAIYKLGQGGGAVLNIKAIKILGAGDTLEGTSFIVLTPEKDNEAIVTVSKKEINK